MQSSFFEQSELLAYWKEQLLPSLLATRGDRQRTLRIWSVGCQTGDEATALVLALNALLGNQLAGWQIRMLVTDPDRTSLTLARRRVYLDLPRLGSLLQDEVPVFEWAANGYRLCKPLRDLLVFAPHDLLVQPPFSHLDLIVCHLPLSSWMVHQQAGVLNRFAYALSSGGLLMLVAPEEMALPPGCFACLDPHWGLYRRTQIPVSFSSLGWKSSSPPVGSPHPAASACPPVDHEYLEELQASLEEQEVLYQELEERTQALETAYQELEQLSGLKDDFLSLASHELRTHRHFSGGRVAVPSPGEPGNELCSQPCSAALPAGRPQADSRSGEPDGDLDPGYVGCESAACRRVCPHRREALQPG